MATKKEIEKRLEEDKERLAAFHRGNREAEKEAQGGSLPFKHRQVEEVEHKNSQKQRMASKQKLREIVHGARDDY